MDWLPLVAFVPLQPPEAVQHVASDELQVSAEDPPLLTLVGLAVRVTVGAGGGGVVTVTVAVRLALPLAPVQVSVKLVLAANGPVDLLPLVALTPRQPPEALHRFASVELQLRVDEAPGATEVGLDVSVTVGAAAPDTCANARCASPNNGSSSKERLLFASMK